jgi:hypothetical protein
MIGDYFLAVKSAPLHSGAFLCGVAGFSLAQACWIVFLRRHGAMSRRIAFGLLFSLGILFGVRLVPALRSLPLALALGGYMLLSVTSVPTRADRTGSPAPGATACARCSFPTR